MALHFFFIRSTKYLRNMKCIRCHSRLLHTNINPQKKNETGEVKKFRFIMLKRYLEYIKNYDKTLESRFPNAVKAYKGFMNGFGEFYQDLKRYAKIVHFLRSGHSLDMLTCKELQLYYQMPRDIWKVAPILFLATFPFSNYIILPILILFPRQLLTSHFWNDKQKEIFFEIYLKKRIKQQIPIYNNLKKHLLWSSRHPLQNEWSQVIQYIDKGEHPLTGEILNCKELFCNKPYGLIYLKRRHKKHLAKLFGVKTFWNRTIKLAQVANVIHAMDKAIMREGGVHNLSESELKNACTIRGLNPKSMSSEQMVRWLNQWIEVSLVMDNNCVSLLLHCPVLLAYNEPSNIHLRVK